jgi:hypothetical protein
MKAAVQTVSFFQETAEERMIPLALGFRDLSLHLLAPLPLPAIHQLVEGF